MTTFTEDKLFKNVKQEDVKILLDIINIKSKEVKLWTNELRLLDPKDFIPDMILELDDINLILELQSTKVNDNFSKRALTYVAMVNKVKKNDKQVTLVVLSTAEDSKIVHYKYGDNNIFTYKV